MGTEVLTPTGTGTDISHWFTSTTDSEDGAVRKPGVRRGLNHPLLLVAAAVVLAVVVWNLFRAPTAEVQGLAGDLDVMRSTAIPSDVDADDPVPAEEDPADDASTTTTADSDSMVLDVSGLDPALTGYDLFAQHSGRLLRVDLATGVVESHNVDGRLLGEFARRLYFVDSSAAVVSLPVDDLGAEPVPEATPLEEGHDLVAAALTENGLVHLTTAVFSSAEPDLAMIRIDLTSGSEQRSEMYQYGTFGLVEVAGAGLFELTGDGFRRLVDGSVRFYGERLIVIEECAAPDTCRRYWFDRETGQEVDRPVPDGSSGWVLGPGGRVTVTFTGGRRIFVDTESGEPLPDLFGAENQRGLSIPDDLTPDERFLAAVPASDSGNVEIHDLLRGESWTIDLPRTFNLTKVLFVPKESTGDDG